MIRFGLLARGIDIINQLPTGDDCLALCAGEPDSDLRALCSLGVIEPGEYADGKHTVVYEVLQNGPTVQAFLAAAKARPDHVWIVATAFTLETAIAALVLMDRASERPLSLPPADPRADEDKFKRERLLQLVAKVDEAGRFSRRWIARWPGIQGGYGENIWVKRGKAHEVRKLAAANQLVKWHAAEFGERIGLDSDTILKALRAWLEGDSPDARGYPADPEATALFEAVRRDDMHALLMVATDRATESQYETVRELNESNACPTFFGDGKIAQVDVTGGEDIPAVQGALVGFSLAPVVAVFFTGKGATIRYSVWPFNDAYFDEARFLELVRANDPEGGPWEVSRGNKHRPTRILSPTSRPTKLTREAFLTLVEQCRRQ